MEDYLGSWWNLDGLASQILLEYTQSFQSYTSSSRNIVEDMAYYGGTEGLDWKLQPIWGQKDTRRRIQTDLYARQEEDIEVQGRMGVTA